MSVTSSLMCDLEFSSSGGRIKSAAMTLGHTERHYVRLYAWAKEPDLHT